MLAVITLADFELLMAAQACWAVQGDLLWLRGACAGLPCMEARCPPSPQQGLLTALCTLVKKDAMLRVVFL
jgi:hypothetical protein